MPTLGGAMMVLVALSAAGCASDGAPFVLTLALALAATVSACRGTPYECCEPYSMGRVGRLATCYCPEGAICNYGIFGGHSRCADDPSGQACVAGPYGPDVRCFDEGGPTFAVECCEDIGGDGIGQLATCRCPVFGDCAWRLPEAAFERVDDTGCRLRSFDAGVPDAPDAGTIDLDSSESDAGDAG